MNTKPLSVEDDSVLHFACRYALGRRTAAVSLVCNVIKRDWPRLRLSTRIQLQGEIRAAIDYGAAGDPCDVLEWSAILKLPIQV